MGCRVNHYMSEVQNKKLNNFSKKTGHSVSELIRRTMDDDLEKHYEK